MHNNILVSRNASNATDSAVKVNLEEHESSEINSQWSNEELLKVKSIMLDSDDSRGSFLSAQVFGVGRIFDASGNGVVLFQTHLGRFVLINTTILPAEDYEGGVLANATSADIMNGIGTQSNSEYLPACSESKAFLSRSL